jgi:hypothetical protein
MKNKQGIFFSKIQLLMVGIPKAVFQLTVGYQPNQE